MTEREKNLGITFNQLLAAISVVAVVLAAWIAMNVKLADIDARVRVLEQNRIENRQEHQQIMDKLDKVIYNLKIENGNGH